MEAHTTSSSRARFEAYLYRNHAFVHGIKTALATALGLCLAWLLKPWIEHPEWIVISTVVVMTMLPNVGGVIQRAIYRLVATIMATIVALIVIFLTNNDWLAVDITLVVGVMIFTFIAQNPKYRQVGMLSAVTLTILLASRGPNESVILWRSLDILLGVSLALLVSRFVFPIRASRQLRFQMADSVEQLGTLFTMAASEEEKPESEYEKIEDRIAAGFMAQRQSLPLAQLENKRVRQGRACLQNMMRSQRALLGLSRTLRRAYSHTDLGESLISSLDGLDDVRNRISEQLEEISQAIRMGRTPTHDQELGISHSSLKVNMKQAAQNVGTPLMSPQTFIFIIEQIIHVTQSLHKDATRVAIDLANAYPSIESDDTVAA